MARVTEIKPQRRRRDRVSVSLDGEFWCGMSATCAAELGLKTGVELDKDAKRKAEDKIARSEALGWALERLGQRSMSTAQISIKLSERGYGEEVVVATLARLADLYVLNDERYGQALIESRRAQGYGRRRLERALKDAGIEVELSEQLLERNFDTETEADEAERALGKRFKLISRTERKRALDFLIRRGFSASAAQRAVEARLDPDEDAESLVDQAWEALQRRYRTIEQDPKSRQRAAGFLARRGYPSETISLVMRRLSEQR